MHTLFAADREDRHNVRMLEMGRGLGLVAKTLQMARIERGPLRQHLQRHAPAQRTLNGLVHNAHAAAADFAHDFVIVQTGQLYAQMVWGAEVHSGRALVHEVEAVEVAAQFIRNVRIASPQLLAVQHLSRLQGGEIIFQRRGDARIVGFRGSGDRRELFGHDPPCCSRLNDCRRRPRRRPQAFDGIERPSHALRDFRESQSFQMP